MVMVAGFQRGFMVALKSIVVDTCGCRVVLKLFEDV